jgi:hypothetical protein
MNTTEPLTVTIEVDPSPRMLHDLFVTACEGGVNYWASFVEYRWSVDGDEPDLDGFYAVLVDEEGGERFRLDADSLRRGLIAVATDPTLSISSTIRSTAVLLLVADRYPSMGIDVDYDAYDADAIAQVGLFGEVVYG